MTLPHLLLLSTRLTPDPAEQPRLTELAGEVQDWEALLPLAERHGVGPLLYRHLRAAQVNLPPKAERALMGMYVSSRHANRVRTQVLAQVLQAFRATGVEVLVVKGGALCHLLYPDPALRPMSDIDLLVRSDQLQRASDVLCELGMGAPLPPSRLPDKSLPTAGCTLDGVWVGIELHDNLFEPSFGASMTLADLRMPPMAFSLAANGPIAYTLGREELLWHLCEHLRFHAAVFTPWRLIWVADILGMVERYAAQLDWGAVAQQYPQVLRTLSLLQHLRPLSPEARLHVPPPAKRAPGGVGEDFSGWPRYSLAQQRSKGLARLLKDTLWPPEWWLRLHQGLGSDEPLWRVRCMDHPREMLGWIQHYWRHRSPRPSERPGRERSRA